MPSPTERHALCLLQLRYLGLDMKSDCLDRRHIDQRPVAQLDWESALAWSDERTDYCETRKAALALLEGRLYFVVFVDRADVRRVISLRRANSREVNQYAEND